MFVVFVSSFKFIVCCAFSFYQYKFSFSNCISLVILYFTFLKSLNCKHSMHKPPLDPPVANILKSLLHSLTRSQSPLSLKIPFTSQCCNSCVLDSVSSYLLHSLDSYFFVVEPDIQQFQRNLCMRNTARGPFWSQIIFILLCHLTDSLPEYRVRGQK